MMDSKRTITAARFLAALIVLLVPLVGCSFAMLGDGETSVASLAITMKQPAATVSSVAVVVTGPNMAPISQTISSADSEVNLEVPAGRDRTFRVLVNTASVTFMGASTVDVAAGQETTVTLYPVLYATQILLPDARNYRLVQISDMNGAGWTEIDYNDLGQDMPNPWDFVPYDVDFDAEGRIYVANNADGILRLDDIYDSNTEWFARGTFPTYIAIDRNAGYLYLNDGNSSVSRVPTSNPALQPEVIDLASLFPTFTLIINGIDVDDQGALLVALYRYNFTTGFTYFNEIYRINPNPASSPAILGVYEDPVVLPYTDYSDILARGDAVYVTNPGGPDGRQVLRLTAALADAGGFGDLFDSYSGTPMGPGKFWGPRHFVAILNNKVHVTDEGYDGVAGGEADRLVAFDGPTGTGWLTYGENGIDRGQFQFHGFFGVE